MQNILELIYKTIYKIKKFDLRDYFLLWARTRKKTITHGAEFYTLYVPNSILRYRADTFSTKEPGTLTWIDNFIPHAVFWDVGANVGLYSIYAGRKPGTKIFSMEPSVFNLEYLARNVVANDLQERIVIVPLCISDSVGVGRFNMSSTAWGGALSTFKERFDQNGNDLKLVFTYHSLGISLDNIQEIWNLPAPDYLKIDVDGLEHYILKGGEKVLSVVRSVLVEINDDFPDQALQAKALLNNAGLTLSHKFPLGPPHQFNQIWHRS